jgi:cytochrome c peroxidase
VRGATPRGLDEYFPVPDSNPLTSGKIALGRRLFFDPLLSADRSIACSSCHRPTHAWGDTAQRSLGIRAQATLRNAPSILNRAYGRSFFWDGRASSLEEAVLQPIRDEREMGLALPILIERLRRNRVYDREFAQEFAEGVSESSVSRALASFVRSLRSGSAPVDRYLTGDHAALSSDALAGLKLFSGKANCVACHVGPTFTDEQFHNTGVTSGGDTGRALATGREEDRGKFKVPSLRNVALTAPYMHDGSVATLEAVIDLYDRGGVLDRNRDPEIKPLRLTGQEKRSLLAFLQSLTGEIPNR